MPKNTKCGFKTGGIHVFVAYICTHYRVYDGKLTDPITGNKTTNKDMVNRVVGDLLLDYYSVYTITNEIIMWSIILIIIAVNEYLISTAK